nr:hypothetical protein [uncultured Pseudomonas sp.]
MRYFQRFPGLLLGVMFAATANAQDETPEQLFSTFSRCDASFFQALQANPATVAAHMELSSQNGVSSPRVANRLQEGGRYQAFREPLVVNGVRLLGYYDEAMTLSEVGNFLFWGFVAEGDVEQVAGKLRPLVANNARFVTQRNAVTRPEMRRVGDPIQNWRTENLPGPGNATPFGNVERILSVESGGDKPPFAGGSKVFCSLQGTVTAPLLQVYRPDLDAHLFD